MLFRPDEASGTAGSPTMPWLLEMPRPFTRLTWDNAALIAPATAARLGIETEDVLTIAANGRSVRGAVFCPAGPGRRLHHVAARLRPARRRARGRCRLRCIPAAQPRDAVADRRLRRSARPGTPCVSPAMQGHDRVAGRDLIREGDAGAVPGRPAFSRTEAQDDKSLYPGYGYPGYAWAMAIDLNSCIGCQACVIACQAENNVPVVGKDQVLAAARCTGCASTAIISGPPTRRDIAFEPVPCMHCENAPCEVGLPGARDRARPRGPQR